MAWLDVLQPGFLTTVQDLGRGGYTHLGVSPCGAADALSLRAGNRLVGNPDGAAAIEMTLVGSTFTFDRRTGFALTGSDFDATLDGRPIEAWTTLEVPAGAPLRVGRTRGGARCYLCVAGGVLVAPFLGSASTDLRAGFGGLAGRPLRRGDRLELGSNPGPARSGSASALRAHVRGRVLRVTRGPQADWFPADALARLCSGAYTVRDESNRVGVRLGGEPIVPVAPRQLITEGVSLGAIQIPPDGQPIILFVDQQTTGGYPKLANVISADLPRVGQLVPRGLAQFVEVDLATARAALRMQEARLTAAAGASR